MPLVLQVPKEAPPPTEPTNCTVEPAQIVWSSLAVAVAGGLTVATTSILGPSHTNPSKGVVTTSETQKDVVEVTEVVNDVPVKSGEPPLASAYQTATL